MSLDVVYQGLPIAKAARVRFEEGALFVETEGPMPVATALLLSHEDKSLSGRVRRVREGAGAGMFIVPAEAGKLPRWLIAQSPETASAAEFEPEAPAVVAAPAPAPVQAPAQAQAQTQAEEPAPTSSSSPAPAATEAAHAAEAAPSNRTPDSENGEAEDDGQHAAHKPGDKKPAAGGAKPKKKPRRR